MHSQQGIVAPTDSIIIQEARRLVQVQGQLGLFSKSQAGLDDRVRARS